MITRKQINKAIGEFIDNALDAYGLHAVRRSVDSPDVIDRRSVRIILDGTRLEPASGYRIVHQEVSVEFYPEDRDVYRDECWAAVDALSIALTRPIVVENIYIRNEDEIDADTSGDYVRISFTLFWFEVAEDSSVEYMEELEMEV